MSNTKGFLDDLDKFADSLDIGVETVVKKIALEVFNGVVLKTPVDTGRARASWVIGVERRVNSPKVADGRKFSEQEAQNLALRQLAALDTLKPYETVFISNSLPYIGELEDGSSFQAPLGMVAVTLSEVKQDIRRITDEF